MQPTAAGRSRAPTDWRRRCGSKGIRWSATSVRRLLAAMGYSLQANRKTREGAASRSATASFATSPNGWRRARKKRRGEPALSVDTKKKEVLGNLKNAGQTYRPKGQPEKVKTHDFPDPKLGKAIPYGVYDIHGNEAGVSVGISHDTAEFAVAAIRRWWKKLGRGYGGARAYW
ncbi:MAG: hypothetical protein U0793_16930 [Gemmataceae bacterium]